MAIVKGNVTGVTRSVAMELVYGGKCGNCGNAICYNRELEIGHIEARSLGLLNNGKVNHHVGNLVPLCKRCNLAMGTQGIEFFENSETREFMAQFAKATSFANDIRTIFKHGIVGRFGQVVTMADIRERCEYYALQGINKTFVRRYRDGIYK